MVTPHQQQRQKQLARGVHGCKIALLSNDPQVRTEALASGYYVADHLPDHASETIQSLVDECQIVFADVEFLSQVPELRESHAAVIGLTRLERGIGLRMTDAISSGVASIGVVGWDSLPALVKAVQVQPLFSVPDVRMRVWHSAPEPIQQYLEIFTREMRHGVNVNEVARLSGVSRRKLTKDFFAAGWPPPGQAFRFVRIIVAAQIAMNTASVPVIAHSVGMSCRGFRYLCRSLSGSGVMADAQVLSPLVEAALGALQVLAATLGV